MNYRAIAVLAVAVLFAGCAPTILVTKDFQDASFSIGQIKKESSVKIYVSETVNLMEFKKAFADQYQSPQQFAAVLRQQITDSMKLKLHCEASAGDPSQNLTPLLSASLDKNSVEMAQALFDGSKEDYFFVVRSIDIANSISGGSGPMFVGGGAGGGGMFVGGSGSSESCIVTIHADLWNVKEKNKLLSYAAVGQSQVFMLFFGTALKEAVEKSIRHLLKYLATGATY